MSFNLNTIRKSQLHSSSNKVWNHLGIADFTDFYHTDALTGDNWKCTAADGVVVNNIEGNIILYHGDIVIAMKDNPGSLSHANVNNGNWYIIRKNPVGSGTKKSYVDGGYFLEASIDNDYYYLCVQAGVQETLEGACDGTAVWKKIHLLLT